MFEKIKKDGVYFIAEMSANHGGDLETALQIVREAARAGADCVKIQTYTADTITLNCDNEYFQIHGGLWDGYSLHRLYEEAATPYEWHAAIKEECEKCAVDFLSTPFDNSAVDFLEDLGAEAYKIASFELIDIPLIEYTASKGKPMIISTGMGTPEEIEEAVTACRNKGNDSIVLLKCCSEYPSKWEDMHLGNIPDMRARYGTEVGLSDHSMGSLGAVVGAALGATVIEKHVKLAGVISADSGFSMDMEDYAAMIQDVKNAKIIAAGPDYSRTEGEKESLVFRRSIFASKDIRQGETLTEENIRIVRPAQGLHPRHYPELMGKTAARDIAFGMPLKEEDIQ